MDTMMPVMSGQGMKEICYASALACSLLHHKCICQA